MSEDNLKPPEQTQRMPPRRVALIVALLVYGAAATGLAIWSLRSQLAAQSVTQNTASDRDRVTKQMASLKKDLDAAREDRRAADQNLHQTIVAEEEDQQTAEDAQRALRFIEDKVFSAGSPVDWTGPPRTNVSLLEAIDAAEPQVSQEFTDRPQAEALVRIVLGRAYLNLQKSGKAVKQLELALALRQKALGPKDPATTACRNELARAYRAADRITEANRLYDQ